MTITKGEQGEVWRCWQKNADGAAVADNGQQNFVIDLTSLPARSYIAITYDALPGGDGEVTLWEDITYESGSAFTPLNKFRASTKTPHTGVVIKSGATVTTSGGTQLVGRWIPGGNGPNASGGSLNSVATWYLKHGKKYALILINRAGSAQDMSLGFHFSEEKDN